MFLVWSWEALENRLVEGFKIGGLNHCCERGNVSCCFLEGNNVVVSCIFILFIYLYYFYYLFLCQLQWEPFN